LNLEVLVDADLDTLATALYIRIDDWLKREPERAPWRPTIGICPQLSDSEALTLAVLQALLGHVSEARWLRFARQHLRHLFPCLPQQPGYNKRLRKLAGTMSWLIRMLARDTTLWTDDVWVVDSTPVECGRSRETAHRSELAGWAEYGYCASHSAGSGDCACTCSAPCTDCPSGSRSPEPKPTSARSCLKSWPIRP
jgi:hypothetical protein